jgi:hypothetical protein
MHTLAMLAVLLMVLMPSAGRLLAGAAKGNVGGLAPMCTSIGLQWIDAAKSPVQSRFQGKGGKTAAGDDCAYCRLAESPTPFVPFAFGLLPPLASVSIGFPRSSHSSLAANWRGLGSRGPPALR